MSWSLKAQKSTSVSTATGVVMVVVEEKNELLNEILKAALIKHFYVNIKSNIFT